MLNQSIKVQSPGRINIIGEHTDYNNGYVLPAAIDKHTVFELNKNGTPSDANFTATASNESFSFDLKSFAASADGRWENYVMGVVSELQKLGSDISGFDARFYGNVPIGAGMSSSASLECSLAFGLNELFELGLSRWQLIKASQMAEHHFVGIKCGIMDQFASMMGKENQVMLLDCRSLEFEYFPFELGTKQLLLLNTNVSHTLASSEYNNRRAECQKGVELIQKYHPTVNSLRDVTMDMLKAHEGVMDQTIYRRCHHVVSENDRVLAAAAALQQKDFEKLGRLIYQSHESLQHDYEVSCPELDFLVAQTKDLSYVSGSRMMGGGFGGCTINLIEKEAVDEFVKAVSASYSSQFGIALTPYKVNVKNGTSLIN